MKSLKGILCLAAVVVGLFPSLGGASLRNETQTQFIEGAPMQVARMGHHIVQLPTGEVKVFGGHGSGFRSLDTAESISFESNEFSLQSMLYKHDDPAFARLANGHYLIMGGSRDWGIPSFSHAQIYNPFTDTYTPAGSMVRFRAGAGSTLLNNGQVLVAGAWWTHNTAHTYGEVYNPNTNTFSETNAFSVRRSHPIVLPLVDGRAVIFGGVTESGQHVDMPVEIYDPVSGLNSVYQQFMFPSEPGWHVVQDKRLHENQKLTDTEYLFYAWKREGNVYHYRLFTFDTESLAFEWVSTEVELPTSTVMSFSSQPVLSQNKQAAHVLVTLTEGDNAGSVALLSVDLHSGQVYLSERSIALGYSLGGVGVLGLQDNRIFVTGGTLDGSNFNPVNKTFFIEPMSVEADQDGVIRKDTQTQFMAGVPMQVARMGHHIVQHPSGGVSVLGGHGSGFRSLNTAESYSSATNEFSLQSMLYKHDDPAFAKLANGNYLIMGGSSDLGVPNFSHTQIYNPVTDTYSAGGAMVRFRAGAGSALLNNGKVLVVGAWWMHNTAHTYGEVYNPETNTFSETNAFSVRRSHPIVLPLVDGRAVIFGGITETGQHVDMPVEIYDPVSGLNSVYQQLMFPSEPGWNVMQDKRLHETQKVTDTKYVFYAWKRDGGIYYYRLFTFDTATLAFEWVPTEVELPSSTAMWFGSQPVLSQNKQAVHVLVTLNEGDDAGSVAVLSVDLQSGHVYLSENRFRHGFIISGTGVLGLQDGRILVTGGSADGSNFNPVNTTFWIEPMLLGSEPEEPEDPHKSRRRSKPIWLYILNN